MLFARSLRHALRFFCQAHNALQVAQAGGPHNETLLLTLRELPSFSTSPQLFYSRRMHAVVGRDAITNEYTLGELTGLIDWLVMFAGSSRRKAREDTLEARRTQASKLAHERGGITKVASALISPPAAPQKKVTGKATQQAPHRGPRSDCNRQGAGGITCRNYSSGEQEQQPNVASELLDAQG